MNKTVLNETTRRQKAQSAIQGKNRKVKTIGIISAENPMGISATKEYNKQSHDELLRHLSIGHYRYYEVKGLYNSPEHSVLVYNISLEDTLYLAYKFNQESVIYVDMSDADNISYQYYEGDTPSSQLKLQHVEQEVVDATNDKDFYTQVSRKFKFRIPFFEDVNKYNEELIECSKTYDVDYIIESLLNPDRTGSSQYYHRGQLQYYIELTNNHKDN